MIKTKKYYEVIAKCGHVGKKHYVPVKFAVIAEDGKEAAKMVRDFPRVKHDHKDAILNVGEIDKDLYFEGLEKNRAIRYFSCYNVQEQRECFCEIEDSIFKENDVEYKHARHSKKRSLRKNYNDDPEFDYYKHNKNFDFFVA